MLITGHHPSPQSLLHAVDAGCWLCTKFWSRIGPKKQAITRSSTTENLDFEAGLPPREQNDEFAVTTRALVWESWCTSLMFMDAEVMLRAPRGEDFEMLISVFFGNKAGGENETCMITMQSMGGRVREGKI